MRKIFIGLVFGILVAVAAFAQDANMPNTFALADGARDNLSALLEKPAMVSAAQVTSSNGWFHMVSDTHVFTEVPLAKIRAVFEDIPGQVKVFNGKKSKTTQADVVQKTADGTIVNFTTTTPVLMFKVDTPYKALVSIQDNSATRYALVCKQLEDNEKIKGLYATRYAQAVTINGKTYTYIRIYTQDDIPANIVPKSALASGAEDVNSEVLNLLIAAAKATK
jgi:hypothetical protein